jgi:hypothetical protein
MNVQPVSFPQWKDVLASVETTQIYTHVMRKPGLGVRSPFDALQPSPNATA